VGEGFEDSIKDAVKLAGYVFGEEAKDEITVLL